MNHPNEIDRDRVAEAVLSAFLAAVATAAVNWAAQKFHEWEQRLRNQGASVNIWVAGDEDGPYLEEDELDPEDEGQ